MQTDLTVSTPERSDADRLGPSNVAGTGSPGTSSRTAALSLRDRLLLSLGIRAACVAIRAAELLGGEGRRGGRGRVVHDKTTSFRR